jgi:hypothetical protein
VPVRVRIGVADQVSRSRKFWARRPRLDLCPHRNRPCTAGRLIPNQQPPSGHRPVTEEGRQAKWVWEVWEVAIGRARARARARRVRIEVQKKNSGPLVAVIRIRPSLQYQ